MADPQAQSEALIEVDPAENDNDSALEERLSNYTASLTSSVVNYPVEHGRTYHAFRPGRYFFPNDEREMSRLDLTHHMCIRAIGDKLYLAPIEKEKVHRVLDIGTGTGIWAIEVGDEMPGAEVIGNDLSPIQPQWLPPNVKFEVDDVESPWAHDSPFDFIFCRYMALCIADWPKLVRNAYDNLNPGGWVEFQDFDFQLYSDDGTLEPDNPVSTWINKLLDLGEKTGRTSSPGPRLENWVKEAGFTNVQAHKFKFPLGPWPRDSRLKDVGTCNLVQLLSGVEGFSMRLLCDVDGWTEEQVHVLLADVRRGLKSTKMHAQYNMFVVYGQKPESAT